MDNNELRNWLSAPAVIALVMASVRFMVTGNKEHPLLVLGHLVGAGYLAYLTGPYMAEHGYTVAEISLASAAIGFVIPNILLGILILAKKFKDDPAGFVADILARFAKK